MVDKISTQGRSYAIDGRRVVWHPEDDEGTQGNLPDIVIPLRLKMRTVLQFAEHDSLDNVNMAEMLKAILPAAHQGSIEDMDVNDFQDMFSTWQAEYNSVTGGSLGEPLPSPSSSVSTGQPSSTTSGDSVSA